MIENRNILIGFEFGKNASQICYFHRKNREAVSLPLKTGGSEAAFRNCVSTADGENWHFGPEAEYFAREKGEIYVGDIYHLCQGRETVNIAGKEYSPGELLGILIRESLKLLGSPDAASKVSSFMLTTPRVSRVMMEHIRRAYELVGFAPDRCFAQEYDESFFYESFISRNDGRGRKVALFAFEDGQVSFASLSVDGSVKPAAVTLRTGKTAVLENDPQKKDRAFYSLIAESLGTDIYSTIYLVGDGFSTEWAVKSVPLLCKNQRKVFFGDNLYAKGACLAARERVEERLLKGYLYVSRDMVRHNVGMEMQIGGAPGYYPLVVAGRNWYDISEQVEFLMDGEDSIRLIVSDMATKEKKTLCMKLPGLPKRPKRACRLSLHAEFLSAKQMKITVSDLGFGALYPSSGKVWEETMIG